MNLNVLTAVSPIDGRYRGKTMELDVYFSEFALIRYRVKVEIEYFIALCELPLPGTMPADEEVFGKLREIYIYFNEAKACRVKEIEATTNHDVKAVEYFIKEEMKALGLEKFSEFIHFGLTSQDINNTAVPMSLRDFDENVLQPGFYTLVEKLATLASDYAVVPMLARTHGQPASPTRLGKEILVFAERIERQLRLLHHVPFSAKFGGATGNFNAHKVAYPQVDWVLFANEFVNGKLGLERSQTTTQIEHYDNLAAYFDGVKRLNTILIDLCRDMWTYISLDYFKQKIKQGEIGSSAMPHKVNPIDFENAEGNLGIANAILEHLAAKLPISRMQRDLTDSTVLRNIGVPLGHTILAIKSLQTGLKKLVLNQDVINRDLDNNWNVIAEAIQTILRRENYPQPYEALKNLTRTNQAVTRETMHRFIDGLAVSDEVKAELMAITPQNYTGI